MGFVDNIQKGFSDLWPKTKTVDNIKEEEKDQDAEHDSLVRKPAGNSHMDANEYIEDEEKVYIKSGSSDDLWLEEELEVSHNQNETYVEQSNPMDNFDGGVLSELGKLKSSVGGMSAKLDTVIRAIENMPKPYHNGSRMAQTILDRLSSLTEQQKTLDNQQEIIKRQHDAMLKFNDDVIYKTQKGLILELISIADQVRMVMENKREDASYDLMQGLKELEESIEASLSNNSVRRYSETDKDDTVLNRRRQAAIGTETTSDPAKDGHFKSVAPGYEWTMPYLVVNSEIKLGKILEENQRPQTFSFVIRPEEVLKLRYKAPIQNQNPYQNLSEYDDYSQLRDAGSIEF